MNLQSDLLAATLFMGSLPALAVCPSMPSAERFTVSGGEVTDNRTGLVWARCSVGETWSGSECTGTVSTPTHEQALQLARLATGWRLPNVKELSSIVDKGCQNPSIDSTVFPYPATRWIWYWTSSPLVGGGGTNAWVVNFSSGVVNHGDRQTGANAVRLVRASQ